MEYGQIFLLQHVALEWYRACTSLVWFPYNSSTLELRMIEITLVNTRSNLTFRYLKAFKHASFQLSVWWTYSICTFLYFKLNGCAIESASGPIYSPLEASGQSVEWSELTSPRMDISCYRYRPSKQNRHTSVKACVKWKDIVPITPGVLFVATKARTIENRCGLDACHQI